MTAQPWEPRVSRLEGALEQIPARLNDLHDDMTALRTEMTALGADTSNDMTALRAELRGDMTTLRTELHGDITALRTELHGDITTLRTEMHAKIDSNLRWTLGTMVALIAALGAFLHFIH